MSSNIKHIFSAALLLTAAAAMTGCSDNFEYDLDGEGTVQFSTSFSNDVKVVSRASADELASQLSESAIVWISSANGNAKDGVVRKFNGLGSIPQGGVSLAGGNYVAELWAGDSVPASFDKKYYKARVPFTVSNGHSKVELQGKIANVVASVAFDKTVNEVLSDYTMTIGHQRGSLTFTDPENQKGYFMMPSTDKNLTWTLAGKKQDGSAYTRTGVIENARPCTEYILSVRYTGTYDEVGGSLLEIVIDNSELKIEDEITITLPPSIQGYNFDINSPVYGSAFNVGRKSVYISAVGSLESVVVESTVLNNAIGEADVDLILASDAVKQQLQAGGVNWVYTLDADKDLSNLKLNFEEELLNKLDNGEYAIVITATDSYGKESRATLNIVVSDAKVVAAETPAGSPAVWPDKATLTIDIADEAATNVALEYRKKGDAEWISVPANLSRAESASVSINVEGLAPGTTYEYRAVCDGFAGPTLEFTTEQAQQPDNASFEYWQDSKAPYLLYASNQQMYWDSGNHGSKTMGKNVTVPATDYYHSGSRSALLASQFVGIGSLGKFAAGNAFIGEYLATEGTDGVLGFGREFTSRPKALRVWVKYRPVAVTSDNTTNVPDLPKGTMDEGIIYFALTDGSVMEEYNGKKFPVVIRTKSSNSHFFDDERKAKEDIIALGQQVFKGDTEGEGLVEFVIPFEYKRTDLKAKYLIMCIAASRGGDYFVGGNGTNMWIDDVEFIY